jgi:trehalose-6-phosphate synthase
MSLDERLARWQLMMEVLRRNTIGNWTRNFLKALRNTRFLD